MVMAKRAEKPFPFDFRKMLVPFGLQISGII